MKRVRKVRPKSKHALLLELMEKHPRWTYREYAQGIGTSVEVVRSYFSRYGYTKLYNPEIKPNNIPKSKLEPKPEPKPKPKIVTDHISQVASSSSLSRSSGYLKLI